MNLLIDNPEKYIIENIGYKNAENLSIAIEIFLAEQSLYPSFHVLKERQKYEEIYNDCLNAFIVNLSERCREENPIVYYFSFIRYTIEKYPSLSNDDEWKEFVAYKVLYTLFYNKLLKSEVTKLLIRKNEFYTKSIAHNNSILKETLKQNTAESAKDKIINIMILQNHEIFTLEMERVQKTKDYSVYESYKDELNIIYHLLTEGVDLSV